MKRLSLFLSAALLITAALCACQPQKPVDVADTTDPVSSGEDTVQTPVQPEGFSLVYNTVPLIPGSLTDVESVLGAPVDRAEAPSCVHEGNDVLYYYDGLEITTSPSPRGQYLASLSITSDAVSTEEGISIGNTAAEAKAVYGEAEEKFGRYEYVKGNTTLTLMTDGDGIITAISYTYTE